MSEDKIGTPRLCLIAAVAENLCIGAENKLPWHLPEDLKRFRDLTRGHPVLMGRKTFESIGRPLPQRENIVISRDPKYSASGVKSATSLSQAIELAQAWISSQSPEGNVSQNAKEPQIFVIGGAEIYKLALEKADRIYLTLVHQTVNGDAFFPDWKGRSWRETLREDHTSQTAEATKFTYLNLERS